MPRDETELRTLVAEQAALNRVAVTVATEASAERIFDVVTEEVGRLLGADAANLVRLDPSPTSGVIVGKWSEPDVQIPGAGTIVAIEEGSALSEMARTGAPTRMATDDPGVPAELHRRLTALGVTSLVAAPIVLSGEIWGAVVVSLTGEREFPADAEERLGKFAALVAVALANTQARDELATLADEQAALRRVAVAVATEENPELLFNAVSEEIGRLFGARVAATVRYVGDADGAEIVGGWDRDGGPDAPARRTRPDSRRCDRASRPNGPNDPDRSGERATRPPAAHGRVTGELSSGGADRGLRAALGRHLDHDRRHRAIPSRCRDSPREVHEPRRRRAGERGGSRGACRVGAGAGGTQPGRGRCRHRAARTAVQRRDRGGRAPVRQPTGQRPCGTSRARTRSSSSAGGIARATIVLELGSRMTLGGGVVTRVRETGGPRGSTTSRSRRRSRR